MTSNVTVVNEEGHVVHNARFIEGEDFCEYCDVDLVIGGEAECSMSPTKTHLVVVEEKPHHERW